jgi:hypothetical protein
VKLERVCEMGLSAFAAGGAAELGEGMADDNEQPDGQPEATQEQGQDGVQDVRDTRPSKQTLGLALATKSADLFHRVFPLTTARVY